MRLKEWFSWHFPEMGKIVNDNIIFTKLVHKIGRRENIIAALKTEETTATLKEQLTDLLLDEEKAQQILDASKISMG